MFQIFGFAENNWAFWFLFNSKFGNVVEIPYICIDNLVFIIYYIMCKRNELY